MKKLMLVGVCNKCCAVCSVSEKQEKEPPEHRCYRNWSGSSAGMESDIVLEGFRLSEQTHGIRYMRIIGDVDSLVMATLQQSVAYGPLIEKFNVPIMPVKGADQGWRGWQRPCRG